MVGNITSKIMGTAIHSPAAKNLTVATGSRLSAVAANTSSHETIAKSLAPEATAVEPSLKQPSTDRSIALHKLNGLRDQISEFQSKNELVIADLHSFTDSVAFINSES